MDREAWHAAVHVIVKSQTRLNRAEGMPYNISPSLSDLTSLSMTLSRSIHVAANSIISFFLIWRKT